jgi:1-acyl-sn-glycerol-3-phosphate acyltransferase
MIRFLLSRIFLLMGFKYERKVPEDLGSYVGVGAPHTSNWDFITAMSIMYFSKQKCHFIIKDSWMFFPANLFFKAVGAIGINREAIKAGEKANTTDELTKFLQQSENVALWISPEGTRSKREKWKTGFYYIALKANLPIVLAYADWKTKIGGLGKVIHPSGDIEKDMKEIMDFYRPITGCRPEKFSVDLRY